MIINIRGTNGSGKTTLARAFQNGSAQEVKLVQYDAPTKRDPSRKKWVTGTLSHHGLLGRIICVGSYAQAQGGLDTVGSFELQQAAVQAACLEAEHVICEGILASTVAGSWLKFFDMMQRGPVDPPVTVAVCYMDTPIDLCLARIRERQERAGKVREIKEDQVRDKVRSIQATKAKFDAAGIQTYTVPHLDAEAFLRRVIHGGG